MTCGLDTGPVVTVTDGDYSVSDLGSNDPRFALGLMRDVAVASGDTVACAVGPAGDIYHPGARALTFRSSPVGGTGSGDDRCRLVGFGLEAGIDFEHPNAARMYDYYLGGAHNFAVDRELADQVIESWPDTRRWARENRRFLQRVVRYCARQGIDQFLDLGSGIPASGHVHEVAREINPEARVAYVDFEPVAVAHGQEVLRDVPGTSMTRADVRDPASVLSADTITEVIDFARPVAVLAITVMHFVADETGPSEVVARYRNGLVKGSYLAMSHVSADYHDSDLASQVTEAVERYRDSATPAYLRSRRRIQELFGGLPLVSPGLVDITCWRPDGDSEGPELGNYAGVAAVL